MSIDMRYNSVQGPDNVHGDEVQGLDVQKDKVCSRLPQRLRAQRRVKYRFLTFNAVTREYYLDMASYNARYHSRYGYPWYVSVPKDDVYSYMTPIVLYTIEQTRLDNAIEKWNSFTSGNENYTYGGVVENKQSKIEIGGRLRVHGDAQSFTVVTSGNGTELFGADSVTTIPQLFKMIQDAIDAKDIHMLEVEYDEKFGFPTTLFIGRGFDCFLYTMSDRRRRMYEENSDGWLGYVAPIGENGGPWGTGTLFRLNISDISFWRAFFDYTFYVRIAYLRIP